MARTSSTLPPDLIQLGSPLPKPGSDLAPPTEQPLGIYVHIPFCVRKCYYCDFASGPAPEAIRDQYVDALVREIRHSPWRGQRARTVFFGGGTPSELKTAQLRRIVEALRATFEFVGSNTEAFERSHAPDGGPKTDDRFGQGTGAPSVPRPPSPVRTAPNPQSAIRNPQWSEWSIECNPGTVTEQSLSEMVEMGFNRISLGVQSFHDYHLKAIGRIHTAAEAVDAVRHARRAGFRRLNVDLIFCLPGQTLAEWEWDLDRALELEPEHVSLYNLTIEEKSEFGRRHRFGLLALPDEDLSADMYEWAIARAGQAGFDLYEVSNFARPGEECRHNQIYWRQEASLGFGLSAASYVDGLRWANVSSMQRYLTTAGRDGRAERAYEERLPDRDAAGEAVMLALRTREGAELAVIGARYGLDPEREFGVTVAEFVSDGFLRREGHRVTLTRPGLMVADRICAAFL